LPRVKAPNRFRALFFKEVSVEHSERPSYYAVIPAEVLHARLFPAAKLLYGEIAALCDREGYCWARNAYFARLYQANEGTVSKWINALKDAGYISVSSVYDKTRGKTLRRIRLMERFPPPEGAGDDKRSADDPAYYAVIRAPVRYDGRLPANAKILYGHITALCKTRGYCSKSNSALAELFGGGTAANTVSEWVKALEGAGHVTTTLFAEDARITGRRIYLAGGAPEASAEDRDAGASPDAASLPDVEESAARAEAGSSEIAGGVVAKREGSGRETREGYSQNAKGVLANDEAGTRKTRRGWSQNANLIDTYNITSNATAIVPPASAKSEKNNFREREECETADSFENPARREAAAALKTRWLAAYREVWGEWRISLGQEDLARVIADIVRETGTEPTAASGPASNRAGLSGKSSPPPPPHRNDEIARAREKWLENYEALFGRKPLRPDMGGINRIFADAIADIGADTVLAALDAAKTDRFCVNKGYMPKIIFSGNVLSILLKPAPPPSSFVNGVDITILDLIESKPDDYDFSVFG
jgi:hypothetical protein